MKIFYKLTFLLIVLTGFHLQAQDWLPFNIGRTYQYQNTPSSRHYTMQVDSTKTEGIKTVYYFDRKAFWNNMIPKCYFGFKMHLNRENDLAEFISFSSNPVIMDTFRLKLNAKVGENWKFSPLQPTLITLTEKGEKEVFPGVIDSVQVFQTNNKIIWLSKNYGMVKSYFFDYELGTGNLEMNAIKQLKIGTFLPDLRRMYDFQVGDIFIYNIETTDIYGCGSGVKYEIDTIADRILSSNGDTIRYKVNSNFDKNKTWTITELGYTKSGSGYYMPFPGLDLLTNHAGQSNRTTLYKDTIEQSMSSFEYREDDNFATGLGSYKWSNTIAHCAGSSGVGRLLYTNLQCWKTSKSQSTGFNDCIARVLGIENNAYINKIAKVYPNPAQNTLFVDIQQATNGVEIELFDVLGNRQRNQIANLAEAKLDISMLPNGIYYVRIKSNNNFYTQKFVKE